MAFLNTRLQLVTDEALKYVGPTYFRRNGHSGQVPEEITMLRTVVNGNRPRGGVHTVCEVGFNAGHSATVWLDSLDTKLKSFDLFRLPYSNASSSRLATVYPGRIEFFKGPSQVTVPQYISSVRGGTQPLCDVWFVDGDHNRAAPEVDLRNALQASAKGAVIIADDCSARFPAVQYAWRKLIKEGLIADMFNRTLVTPPPGGLKGWCVGHNTERA